MLNEPSADSNEEAPPPVKDYAPIDDINEPMASAAEDSEQQKLDKMKASIQIAADRIRQWKVKYADICDEDMDSAKCQMQRAKIMSFIATLKSSIEEYDSYAVAIHVEVQVSVWMVDLDEVTAEP